MVKDVASEIDEANKKAVEKILSAECILTDMKPAIKAIPGFKEDLITHAGPPIEWERMCCPQKLGVISLIIHEGLADTPKRAERLVETREVTIGPNHNYNNVSGMCGITSASVPVFIVKNKVHGNVATDWQETGVTSYGDKFEKIKEVEFVEKTLAPVMKATIKEAGGIDLKALLVKGLQMGDELHGSFDATMGVFASWILPHIVKTGFSKDALAKVGNYFLSKDGNWYPGNLMMAACKTMMDAARDIKHSTIVTAMCRNGVEYGIRVSGLGDQWFTGPAGVIKGFTFPGYKPEDSTPRHRG